MDLETFELNIEALDERDQYANILIYGESGVGKTVFASSAPRPIIWLEAEGGTASISDKKGIDIAKVRGLASYREALVYLEANPGKYKTVVIDSFSETQAAVLKDIMGAVKKIDENRDEFAPLFAEWGKLTGVMREIARAFRDLPTNLVITALQREDKDDLTGRIKVRPRLSPTLADELPAFMDAVLYLYSASVKRGETGAEGVEADDEGVTLVRNALIRPTGKYVAKARIPKGSPSPDFIADPTFDKVADLLGLVR
jgi:phage nucleotide-binding protein